jgi:pyruvate dehydrogenase E1 component
MLTALYLYHLEAADEVSIKPHASPVLHAINYILGRLDRRYLTLLRAYGGLQSYPSRTKDPDPVDFSTGSVGIGATASLWRAIAHRYVSGRWPTSPTGRLVAVVGDAELDEGAVWEALVDPRVSRLGEVVWIVDVNRQSLDRVVPDIAAGRIGRMFAAAGWHTVMLKYGSRLRQLFSMDSGEVLRRRLDEMSNEEYQHLLRLPSSEVRDGLAGSDSARSTIFRLLDGLDDRAVDEVLRDLGGHDLADLVGAFAEADQVTDRPTVIFAYTIKAWQLPTQGHPGNHSALLSEEQWRSLGVRLGADPDDPWARFPSQSPEEQMCAAAAKRLCRKEVPSQARLEIPRDFRHRTRGMVSTQQAFGRFFLDLRRTAPSVAERIVTVSPDVASSTNLGGWINQVGVWTLGDKRDWFSDDRERLVRWAETTHGQHIELGIAEVNLVGLLSELGATWSRDGQPLLPIGTVYDQFMGRALEPWSFGIYGGGQSILVGTPSGVSLAPEGGAHQSVSTPSIGLEQPSCISWEPAFAQDLEWTLLAALGRLGQRGGTSSYFRLSTRPIDQTLAAVPDDPVARERRRLQVIAGGFQVRRAVGDPAVILVFAGAVAPAVLSAADRLGDDGVACDVICLTSADLIFRALQARRGLTEGNSSILETVFPAHRAAPIVAVLDGHPHTLAFLGAINATPITSLGVSDFGQVGDLPQLYSHFGIDADTILGAAWDLID